ncbi:MAG: helix-turn-helix domain-containing protein [Defluviitaleaceae bacterium]|nr:helix-turn-helix domain-containing protein [Defluviitaleaceae bacterium]
MIENGTRPDVLHVQGRMSRGYGIIPKIPMQDKRLTIEAKAIYSYFCSYAGAGATAFPSRDKILYDLGISKDRFYKHFNLLKKYGYIEVAKNTDNTGKFKNNIYTLVEMIEPCHENKDTAKKPCPYFPDTENKDTKNNIFIINNLKNNMMENQQSESRSKSEQKADKTLTIDTESHIQKEITGKEKRLPEIAKPTKASDSESQYPVNQNIQYSKDDYNAYREIVQENIHYSDFLISRPRDIEMVDELVNAMLDVICTEGTTVKINGEQKSRAMVKSQYLKIGYEDIEHILDRYKDQRHKITHVHAYLKTMLYTCKQENSHYYTNAVRADGVVW